MMKIKHKFRKLFSLLLIILFNFFNAQNIGDYGAISSGVITGSIWGVWNGTSFAGPATTLPATTTKNVYIPAGITVTTPTTGTTTYSFGDLYVYGVLTLYNNLTLSTTQNVYIVGSSSNTSYGAIKWMGSYSLRLTPANASISISLYNGANGLQSGGGSCGANTDIYIGTVKYAACPSGSGNADYSFGDLNNSGGSIKSIPSVTPSRVCVNSQIQLKGAYSGIVTSTAMSYLWTGTGPGTYNYSSTALNPPALITLTTPGTYTYSLKVTTRTNNTDYSNTRSVTVVVDPASVAGTPSANQSICSGTKPSDITLTGYTGNIQWQSSTDNVSFSDITNATSATLSGNTIGSLNTTTYYRAKVTSGVCSSANSNTVKVTVNPLTVISSISPTSQILCKDSTPADLSVSATGTALTYQWYLGNNPISDATNPKYTPPTDTPGTKTYHVVVTGTCGTVTSSDVTVKVDATSVKGTTSSDQVICNGDLPANITLTGYTGNIQWQKSTDNISFSDIVGETNSILSGSSIGAISTTTFYRAMVTSGVCPAVYSNAVKITVNELTVISSNPTSQVLCAGQTPNNLSVAASGTSITYQWYLDGNPISGATNSTYTPTVSGIGTQFYHVVVTGACGSLTSPQVAIKVNPKPSINNMTATVCSGDAINILPIDGTNGTVPSGTIYSWSAPSVTGGMTGGLASSGTAVTGSLINKTGLPQTAIYTVTPKTDDCTGETFTITITVNSVKLTGNPNISGINGTTQLTASPTPGTWVSSDTNVATVDSNGLVTGHSTGTAVIRFTVTATGCYENFTVNVGAVCTKFPTSSTVTSPPSDSKFGITSLQRADSGSSNWPGLRKGAYMVLESKTNGFVLPRMTDAEIVAIPLSNLIKGMAVYNTSKSCFYVYDGTSWNCYKTQTCPQ